MIDRRARHPHGASSGTAARLGRWVFESGREFHPRPETEDHSGMDLQRQRPSRNSVSLWICAGSGALAIPRFLCSVDVRVIGVDDDAVALRGMRVVIPRSDRNRILASWGCDRPGASSQVDQFSWPAGFANRLHFPPRRRFSRVAAMIHTTRCSADLMVWVIGPIIALAARFGAGRVDRRGT